LAAMTLNFLDKLRIKSKKTIKPNQEGTFIEQTPNDIKKAITDNTAIVRKRHNRLDFSISTKKQAKTTAKIPLYKEKIKLSITFSFSLFNKGFLNFKIFLHPKQLFKII
jgi:hypothetical protein